MIHIPQTTKPTSNVLLLLVASNYIVLSCTELLLEQFRHCLSKNEDIAHLPISLIVLT